MELSNESVVARVVKMLPNTKGALIFSRVFALYFQSVAPLSIAYCLSVAFGIPPSKRLPRALETWLLAESLFYLLVYLPMSVAARGPAMKVGDASREQRRDLFNRCTATISDPVRFVSLWHRGAPIASIGRESVKEWICWAFLGRDVWGPTEDEELDEYVDILENMLPERTKFKEGRTPGIETLRLSLDPVNLSHKPLLFYLFGVGGADIYATLVMCSPAQHISYWYRPHTSKTKLPILEIHGIGILHTYGDFFAELAEAIDQRSHEDGQIGIIVLEILPMSFRMAHAGLRPADMRCEIESILDQHSWSRFVLMANSYGTVISTQMLRDRSLSVRICDVVFIDPVTFLLHLPDMTYNFTRRPPHSASEHQLYYFASTDIGAGHTLARRFQWTENILWKEDLGGRRWTVMLSELDIIVTASTVARYLTRPEGVVALEDDRRDSEWKNTKWAGDMDVLWLEGLNHAEVFNTERDRKMVIDIALNYACGESRKVADRPLEYGKWLEKNGLLLLCSPARFASTVGLDKTLDWTPEQTDHQAAPAINGSLSKRRAR